MRYALSEQQVLRWFENAKWLQELKTSRGNQRLFSNQMKLTVLGLHLLPVKIQDRATEAEVDRTINQLRALYSKDKANTMWCIQYWIYNSSLSKAGVRFTDPSKLECFIGTLHSVIPYSRWQLKLLVTPQSTQNNIKSWRVKGIAKPVLEKVKTGKNIQAYLTLRHADEETILLRPDRKRKLSQYSSTLLRYVLHMLAIMIGINPETETRQVKSTPQAVSIETSVGGMVKAQVSEDVQAEPLHAHSPAADSTEQPSLPNEPPLEILNKPVTGYDESSGQTVLEYIKEYLKKHLNEND